MKLWFYRWLISWAALAQGLVGVLTLGVVRPKWELIAAKKYSRARGAVELSRIWEWIQNGVV